MFSVLVFGGLVAGGSVMLVFGVRRFRRSRGWPRVAGTVTQSELKVSSPMRDRGGTIHPTVRYRTLEGRELEVRSEAGDNLTNYRIGRELPVRYDPASPERMVIDRLAQNGVAHALAGGFVALFGGGLLVAALLV